MIQIRFARLGRALIAAAAVSAMAGAQAGSTVQISGPAGPLALDDLFTLSVSGHDFVEVNGGGLNVTFTVGLLELLSVQVDPIWTFWSQPGTIDNGSGALSELAFNAFGWKLGYFPIATLQFQAKAPGVAVVSLAESVDWPFATPTWDTPIINYGNFTSTIAGQVPEPVSWLLLLGGLGWLGIRAVARQT